MLIGSVGNLEVTQQDGYLARPVLLLQEDPTYMAQRLTWAEAMALADVIGEVEAEGWQGDVFVNVANVAKCEVLACAHGLRIGALEPLRPFEAVALRRMLECIEPPTRANDKEE